jgi:hypothetical protein
VALQKAEEAGRLAAAGALRFEVAGAAVSGTRIRSKVNGGLDSRGQLLI